MATKETRIQNLENEIQKVKLKISKLQDHITYLEFQIQRIKSEEPKVPRVPTEEERKIQSNMDKEKHKKLMSDLQDRVSDLKSWASEYH